MNWYKTTQVNKEIDQANKDLKNDYICPFCKESDFDLIGLKNHLEKDCEVYKSIDISSIHRVVF